MTEDQDGTAKKNLQQRAGFWYEQALPELSGLTKSKIEKRLAELPAATRTEERSADADPSSKIIKALQGEWLVISEDTNGEVYPKDRVRETNRRIRIKDHAMTMSRTINGKFGVYEGHFEIEAGTKHFDWSGTNPVQKLTQFVGIFELAGDRLKLCYRYVVGDTPRPTSFKSNTPVSPGMAHISLVLKKVASSVQSLQGNWKAAKAWGGMNEITKADFWKESKTLDVDDSNFTLVLIDGTFTGTLQADETTRPKKITFEADNGMELLGIFKTQGKQLTVAWVIKVPGKPEPDRPADFEPAQGKMMFV